MASFAIATYFSLFVVAESVGGLQTIRVHQHPAVRSETSTADTESDDGPAIDLSQKLPHSITAASISLHNPNHQPRLHESQAVVVDAAGDAQQTVRVHQHSSQHAAPVKLHSPHPRVEEPHAPVAKNPPVEIVQNRMHQQPEEPHSLAAKKSTARNRKHQQPRATLMPVESDGQELHRLDQEDQQPSGSGSGSGSIQEKEVYRLEQEDQQPSEELHPSAAKKPAAKNRKRQQPRATLMPVESSGQEVHRLEQGGVEEEGESVVEKSTAEHLLDLLDQDGDGCVDKAEFANIMIGPKVLEGMKPVATKRGFSLPEEIFTDAIPNEKKRWCPHSSVKFDQEPAACGEGCAHSTEMELACANLMNGLKYFAGWDKDGEIIAMCGKLYGGELCVCNPTDTTKEFARMGCGAAEAVDQMGKKDYSEAKLDPESNGRCGEDWKTEYFQKLVEIKIPQGFSKKGLGTGLAYRSIESAYQWWHALTNDCFLETIETMGSPDHAEVEAALFYSAGKSGGGKGVCVLSWQPTQGCSDWKISLRGGVVDFNAKDSSKGKVQQGFYHAYYGLQKKVIKAFNQSFDGACLDPEKVSDIVFSGHGIGGALALLTKADAMDNWDFLDASQKLTTITTGSPAVGNKDFCGHFTDGKLLQFASEGDGFVYQNSMDGDQDVATLLNDLLGTVQCGDLQKIPCTQSDCHSLVGEYCGYLQKDESWAKACNHLEAGYVETTTANPEAQEASPSPPEASAAAPEESPAPSPT